MSTREELVNREYAAWQALSTDGETAARHYETELAREALMLLPGGLVLDDRQAIVGSVSGPPWEHFEITEVRVLPLGRDAAVLTYRAAAERAGRPYEALCNSTYVREDGEWRLALHQQTPV